MTALHLLFFAAAVSVLAPRTLGRAGWVYRAPGLGITAWYAVLGTVLMAALGAVVAVAAPWQAASAPICAFWRWCLQAAGGGSGTAGWVAAAVVMLAGLGVAIRLVMTTVRLVRGGLAWRAQHVRMLTLAGRVAPELGATVVEHARPYAYMVAGHGRRLVVTTGALEQLNHDEVTAVLAHERAHATGRHDLLLEGVRLLHEAFPRLKLFAAARDQLGRLVEMRADDVARTRHAPINLARALVVMATGGADHAPGVPAAVGATGGDAVERLHRLLTPPAPLSRARRAVFAASIAGLGLVPAGMLVAAHFFPYLGMCPAWPT